MWWLIAAAGLYFFRGKLAKVLPAGIANPQTATRYVFYGHMTALATTTLFLLPLELAVPRLRALKSMAYLISLWSCVMTCVVTIWANNGSPPALQGNFSLSNWRQSLEEAKVKLAPWLQKVMTGVDSHFLFFALIFISAIPSFWALLIPGRRSLWFVCTSCDKAKSEAFLWMRFQPTWAKLKAREAEVMLYSALAEVLLGIWLTVSLMLPTRQFLACLLYWSYLKMRFQMPRSREYHLQAWRQLGQMVDPALKAVPLLNKPIDFAKGWFSRA